MTRDLSGAPAPAKSLKRAAEVALAEEERIKKAALSGAPFRKLLVWTSGDLLDAGAPADAVPAAARYGAALTTVSGP